ncbi:uncharacterized protein BDZ99DRAFT_502260 [Mytilinidion resinicola]|uniref:Uncharacterized protein n=1 Tax=Mytilinidion resinicola TaxID=574789 RepID=A0A6A6Y8C0_9PEZI|nr:uncharacterized protein BDZ99DRAFT_502260 [Mytilinidion resinicola]KAF2804803.1 hypothetical protein BDZ99DRAFT_502260 [Mytilinidion resinicola]
MDNAIAGAVAYRRHDLPAGLAIPEAIMTASSCRCQPSPGPMVKRMCGCRSPGPPVRPAMSSQAIRQDYPSERRAGVRGLAAVGDVVGKAPRSTDFEAHIPRANTHRKNPHLAPTAGQHPDHHPPARPGPASITVTASFFAEGPSSSHGLTRTCMDRQGTVPSGSAGRICRSRGVARIRDQALGCHRGRESPILATGQVTAVSDGLHGAELAGRRRSSQAPVRATESSVLARRRVHQHHGLPCNSTPWHEPRLGLYASTQLELGVSQAAS